MPPSEHYDVMQVVRDLAAVGEKHALAPVDMLSCFGTMLEVAFGHEHAIKGLEALIGGLRDIGAENGNHLHELFKESLKNE
jgi:hypothetical protein